ncbi:hypothetical protein KFL_000460320 [Klebsormidium nitens]|uniref:Root UVB sensitive family n=1 Tax=Klebsormidium nitens TaxID=105231 RepID=A0A1Y1HSZ9_KLENI|nr:hypothetical protein KFL_000460320 [Klebsormidium nitens]|eukprot:GAQ80121.1 hypothetical protein KFL_000460320 [Klebsormidium nitens]
MNMTPSLTSLSSSTRIEVGAEISLQPAGPSSIMALKAASSIVEHHGFFPVPAAKLGTDTRHNSSGARLGCSHKMASALPLRHCKFFGVDSGGVCHWHRRCKKRQGLAVRNEVARVDKKPVPPTAPPVNEPLHAKEKQLVLDERLLDGQIRRYTLRGSQSSVDILKGRTQSDSGENGASASSSTASSGSSSLPRALRDTFLPAGYPDSVTEDYLPYMLWSIPVHITGHACNTLVTSSLLKAVGIGANGLSVGAATAAIRWVTKDGVGALGRAAVGGRFGNLPDEDPRQWRMYADFITTFGGCLELLTPLAPGNFLLLASVGHLCRAVGRGMKNPCFRVIQNHFAVSSNLGNIAAKEDVWEVPAELLGLATGVALLNYFAKDYWSIVGCWGVCMVAHLALRYKSMQVLQFNQLNYKRAAALVRAHVAGEQLPDVPSLSSSENLLLPRSLCQPQLQYGATVGDLIQSLGGPEQVGELLEAYGEEDYVLLCSDAALPAPNLMQFQVVLKEGAGSQAFLRSLYQAAWLQRTDASDGLPRHRSDEKLQSSIQSLQAMQAGFVSFREEAQGKGWDVDKVLYQLPPSSALVGSAN